MKEGWYTDFIFVCKQGFDRALEQSLDSIEAKAKWIERDQTDVSTWLHSHRLV